MINTKMIIAFLLCILTISNVYADDYEQYKAQCDQMGFQRGTEQHAQCTLKLYSDKGNQKQNERAVDVQEKYYKCQNARKNMEEQCRLRDQYVNNIVFSFSCGRWQGEVTNSCN